MISIKTPGLTGVQRFRPPNLSYPTDSLQVQSALIAHITLFSSRTWLSRLRETSGEGDLKCCNFVGRMARKRTLRQITHPLGGLEVTKGS